MPISKDTVRELYKILDSNIVKLRGEACTNENKQKYASLLLEEAMITFIDHSIELSDNAPAIMQDVKTCLHTVRPESLVTQFFSSSVPLTTRRDAQADNRELVEFLETYPCFSVMLCNLPVDTGLFEAILHYIFTKMLTTGKGEFSWYKVINEVKGHLSVVRSRMNVTKTWVRILACSQIWVVFLVLRSFQQTNELSYRKSALAVHGFKEFIESMPAIQTLLNQYVTNPNVIISISNSTLTRYLLLWVDVQRPDSLTNLKTARQLCTRTYKGMYPGIYTTLFAVIVTIVILCVIGTLQHEGHQLSKTSFSDFFHLLVDATYVDRRKYHDLVEKAITSKWGMAKFAQEGYAIPKTEWHTIDNGINWERGNIWRLTNEESRKAVKELNALNTAVLTRSETQWFMRPYEAEVQKIFNMSDIPTIALGVTLWAAIAYLLKFGGYIGALVVGKGTYTTNKYKTMAEYTDAYKEIRKSVRTKIPNMTFNALNFNMLE